MRERNGRNWKYKFGIFRVEPGGKKEYNVTSRFFAVLFVVTIHSNCSYHNIQKGNMIQKHDERMDVRNSGICSVFYL